MARLGFQTPVESNIFPFDCRKELAVADSGDIKKTRIRVCYPIITFILEPAGVKKESHKCDVCGKSFPSHQALGGHKTRHRKRASTTNVSTVNISDPNATDRLHHHQYSTCKKIFPTGQALGAHMRKHFDKGDKNSEEAITSSEGGSASSINVNKRVMRNFDLNLLPSEQPDICFDLNVQIATDHKHEMESVIVSKKPRLVI